MKIYADQALKYSFYEFWNFSHLENCCIVVNLWQRDLLNFTGSQTFILTIDLVKWPWYPEYYNLSMTWPRSCYKLFKHVELWRSCSTAKKGKRRERIRPQTRFFIFLPMAYIGTNQPVKAPYIKSVSLRFWNIDHFKILWNFYKVQSDFTLAVIAQAFNPHPQFELEESPCRLPH